MRRALDILRRAAGALSPARIRRALVARRPAIESAGATLGFLAGLAMVATGVALVHLPSGLIVGGLELAAGSALYARSGG